MLDYSIGQPTFGLNGTPVMAYKSLKAARDSGFDSAILKCIVLGETEPIFNVEDFHRVSKFVEFWENEGYKQKNEDPYYSGILAGAIACDGLYPIKVLREDA